MLLLRVLVLGQLLPKLSRGTGGGKPRGIWSPGGDVTPAYFITFSGTMSGERVEVLGGSDSTQARLPHKSQKTRAREEEILVMPLNEQILVAYWSLCWNRRCCLLLLLRRKGKEGSEVGVGRRLRCDVHWRCSTRDNSILSGSYCKFCTGRLA